MRAAVGFTLALVAMAVHRRARVLNLLAAVAMLFLVIDPGQLFEASFQLSFAAVAAIGGLASPWIDRSARFSEPRPEQSGSFGQVHRSRSRSNAFVSSFDFWHRRWRS